MKRAGFTMIELIFVIVILGILAAVALPKFAGVSDQANAKKCEALVGTLNRTVGPSMWSESIDESNGSVGAAAVTTINVPDHIALEDIPTLCVAAAAGVATATELFAGHAPVASTTAANGNGARTGVTAGIKFGNSTYSFEFYEGNTSSSPRWAWVKTN